MSKKFIASSEGLRRALMPLMRTITPTCIVPILEDALIQVGPQAALVTASDLETTLQVRTDIDTTSGSFELAVPLRRLMDLLTACEEQPLVLHYAEPGLTITGDQFSLKLPTDDAAQYVKVHNEFHKLRAFLAPATADRVLAAFKRAVDFTSSDDLRPAMTGVYFRLAHGKLRIVSTDAHRLYWDTIELEHAQEASGIIPVKSLRTLLSVAKGDPIGMNFAVDDRYAMFSLGRYTLTTRLIDARFPDYEVVLPDPATLTTFVLRRREVMAFAKLAGRFSDKSTSKVRLMVDAATGTVATVAKDESLDHQLDYRLRAYEFSAPLQSSLSLNINFFAQALRHKKDDYVKIAWSGAPTKPIVVDDHILIMPLMDSDNG